jgi:tripartite ATP-independent transporter DctM subunit
VIGLFAVLMLLLLLGTPIAFALAIAATYFVATETQLPMLIIFQRMVAGVDSFPFMAIPFFMLAGSLVNTGGLSDRVITLARAMVGHLAGGLANVSIASSLLFAGVSGSSVADASGLGRVLIPAMEKEGYDPRYAAAINATSSTVGIIIPPSIPMILAAVATGLSVRELFFGGALPGLLAGLMLIVASTFISRRRGYGAYRRATFREFLRALLGGLPVMGMVVIILGGILGGIFTPTEASVVAVFYALALGVLLRAFTWTNVKDAFLEAVTATSVVMLVIAASAIVTWLMARSMIPQWLAREVGEMGLSPTVLLLLMAIAFLVIGTVLDVSPGVLLLGPILLPVAVASGVEPVHFCVVLVFALAIGLFTPPVGTTLIISSYIAKAPVLAVARQCLPFLAMMVGLLFLIVLIPDLALWLPRTLFGP